MHEKAWLRVLVSRGRDYQEPSETSGWLLVRGGPVKTYFTSMTEVAGIGMTKNELVNNLGMIGESGTMAFVGARVLVAIFS